MGLGAGPRLGSSDIWQCHAVRGHEVPIEVIVDELEFMSSRNKTDGYDANAEFAAIPSSLSPDSTASVYDEDIPF